jgi:hypothetical protein
MSKLVVEENIETCVNKLIKLPLAPLELDLLEFLHSSYIELLEWLEKNPSQEC